MIAIPREIAMITRIHCRVGIDQSCLAFGLIHVQSYIFAEPM